MPESVVDLAYRVTLNRLDVVRVACVSDVVRAQLRYALVSFDTLRARSLGFEVEAVVESHGGQAVAAHHHYIGSVAWLWRAPVARLCCWRRIAV